MLNDRENSDNFLDSTAEQNYFIEFSRVERNKSSFESSLKSATHNKEVNHQENKINVEEKEKIYNQIKLHHPHEEEREISQFVNSIEFA